MTIQKLKECTASAEAIADTLYANDVPATQQLISETVKNINGIYLEYINRAEELKKHDIDIPADILLSQMQNLMEAIDSKDIIKLADTMIYEIKEGLLFFTDIENELGGIQA